MQAVIFDLDGTLIESMAIDTDLYLSAITAVLGAVRIRKNLGDYEDVTDSGILAQIIADNNLVAASGAADRVQALFIQELSSYIRDAGPFPAIPGAIRMLETARLSADKRVAIATGGWRESALLKLSTSRFNVGGIPVATCDDSPTRVTIMRKALAELGSDFESVTYFGDAEWDRQACRELGWDFVAVGPALQGITSFEGVEF